MNWEWCYVTIHVNGHDYTGHGEDYETALANAQQLSLYPPTTV